MLNMFDSNAPSLHGCRIQRAGRGYECSNVFRDTTREARRRVESLRPCLGAETLRQDSPVLWCEELEVMGTRGEHGQYSGGDNIPPAPNGRGTRVGGPSAFLRATSTISHRQNHAHNLEVPARRQHTDRRAFLGSVGVEVEGYVGFASWLACCSPMMTRRVWSGMPNISAGDADHICF